MKFLGLVSAIILVGCGSYENEINSPRLNSPTQEETREEVQVNSRVQNEIIESEEKEVAESEEEVDSEEGEEEEVSENFRITIFYLTEGRISPSNPCTTISESDWNILEPHATLREDLQTSSRTFYQIDDGYVVVGRRTKDACTWDAIQDLL